MIVLLVLLIIIMLLCTRDTKGCKEHDGRLVRAPPIPTPPPMPSLPPPGPHLPSLLSSPRRSTLTPSPVWLQEIHSHSIFQKQKRELVEEEEEEEGLMEEDRVVFPPGRSVSRMLDLQLDPEAGRELLC